MLIGINFNARLTTLIGRPSYVESLNGQRISFTNRGFPKQIICFLLRIPASRCGNKTAHLLLYTSLDLIGREAFISQDSPQVSDSIDRSRPRHRRRSVERIQVGIESASLSDRRSANESPQREADDAHRYKRDYRIIPRKVHRIVGCFLYPIFYCRELAAGSGDRRRFR
jgi:hypothetical protein